MSNKDNITGYLLFFMFLGMLLFVLYDIFRTEGMRFTSIMLPTIVICIIFMNNYGVFSTWVKGRGFYFKSGVKGTVVSGPLKVDNNRIKFNVSVFGQYIGEDKRAEVLGGFWWFYFLISQRIVIEVVDHPDKFKSIPSLNCEDPKGCIVYSGSINDIEVWDEQMEHEEELKKIRHERDVLKTGMRQIYLEIETLSLSQKKDLANAAQTLKTIMSNIERPIIIAGGAPGGGASITDLNNREGQ